MPMLLKVVMLIPSKYRRILKDLFPKLASAVLTMSSNLRRWQIKQEKLREKYDYLAEINGFKVQLGPDNCTREIVVVTPTHPSKTGIATYSANLVSELSLISGVKIVSSFLEKEFVLLPGLRATLTSTDNGIPNSEILYMLGNGEHHWNTWNWMLRYPGFVLIHDAKIPDIPLMEGEDPSWYNLEYSEKSNQFLGRLPLHTKGVITHSRHAAEIVKRQLSEEQLKNIDIHVLDTGHPTEKSTSIPKSLIQRPIIATFGFQTANKNLNLTYMLISFLASKTNGKGLICGRIDRENTTKAKKIWGKFGNNPSDLSIYSWVDTEKYDALMASVSVGVQLRSTTNGESSGPFTQLTSQGIPTIVTDLGAFSEFPPLPGVLKIPPVIHSADIESICAPMLELLKNDESYYFASRELVDFYQNKTYDRCAAELLKIIFE